MLGLLIRLSVTLQFSEDQSLLPLSPPQGQPPCYWATLTYIQWTKQELNL